MPNTFNLTVSESGKTAVDLLAKETGLAKLRIKDAMNKGACWWTTKGKQLRLRRATRIIEKGVELHLYYDENILAKKPQTSELICDYSRYSIWYKPHGMLAQGSQWGDHCSLMRVLELAYKRPCFLVHRLDADAAGLMIVAHDAQATGKLSSMLQERSIKKHYLAWVTGKLDTQGQLVQTPVEGKEAITWISTLQFNEDASLLRVTIETGRKHQIRQHLASLGHPIIGEKLYDKTLLSNTEKENEQSLQLLAYQLEFDCPFTKKQVSICLPDEIVSSFKNLISITDASLH
jgi:tRNA pseudouridine32 synthase / 23S rRNA pseudouridine746 synthase